MASAPDDCRGADLSRLLRLDAELLRLLCEIRKLPLESRGNVVQMPDVTIERILKGRISAIGLAKGRFGAKKQISWDDLTSMQTICMRQENMVRASIDAALAKSGKNFAPTFEVSLFNTALSMTASGVGVTILPDYLLARQQFPTLMAKPLTGPAIEYQMSLIRKIGRSLSPAAAKFVGLVRAELGRVAGSRVLQVMPG
jgi:DNA-binding transcriptional LysR family regulator